MTTLELIETKVPELNREELYTLLDKVTHALKNYHIEKSSNRSTVIAGVSSLKDKNLFDQIADPVAWQREIRNEWEK